MYFKILGGKNTKNYGVYSNYIEFSHYGFPNFYLLKDDEGEKE